MAVWSIVIELIGPHYVPHAVGDPWDALCYAAGGGLAFCWWQRHG